MNITKNAFCLNEAGSVSIPVGKKDFRELATSSYVTAFGQRERYKRIVIEIPERLLKTEGEKTFLIDWKPYNDDLCTGIARRAAPKWGQRTFGMIPGTFFHDSEGTLRFIGELNPFQKCTDAILFYADASMKGYSGANGLTSFRFGNSNFYGIILPLNYLPTQMTIPQLRMTMEKSIKEIFA